MQRLLLSLLFIPLFLVGCAYNESVTQPETNSTQQLLLLPSPQTVLEKNATFSKKIDGTLGGVIDFSYSYKSHNHSVNVYGYLEVPCGAFNGIKTITFTLSKKNAVIDLFPSPLSFDIPLNLSIIYEGIDLRGITGDQYNFTFIGDNGLENVEYSQKLFNADSGMLGIVDAKLYHFSRYGWVY